MPEGSSSENQTSSTRRTILVIEDEPLMLGLLDRFLSRQGYRVLTASDGELALEAYRRHKSAIDLVLLDVGLPRVKGLDVLLKMKSENPDIRVIVASGYLETEMKTDMDRAGVRDFVDKPYRLSEMLATLERCMAR